MRTLPRRLPAALVSGAALLVACQAAPTPAGPGATPTPQPSSSLAATSPSPSASVAPTASPLQTVYLHGNLYADGGVPLSDGQVAIQCDQYPQLNGVVPAQGGAFIIANVPVGAVLQLRASSAGYGARQRNYTAQYHQPDSPRDTNRVDFGGPVAPLYGLSKYPDIVSVTPINGAQNVSPDGLNVQLTFSEALSADSRQQLASLLRVRLPIPSGSSGGASYQNVQVGTTYQDQVATLAWNASGTVATFAFGAPIALGLAGQLTATVSFDQSRSITDWPVADNGLPLGFMPAPDTYEGGGALVHNQIAAFQRDLSSVTLPSPSPGESAAEDWGLSHATTSLFTMKGSDAAVHVVSVTPYAGSGSTAPRFLVKFDQPVRGYPEANLDGSALSASNYRFTVGNENDANAQRDFANSDPTTGGMGASGTPTFAAGAFDTVVVPVNATAFTGNTEFKFYVDPAVKDIDGVHVTGQVIQGRLP